ncbi:hypothetical protein EVJ58_g1168 [Rhodofomes roseus]|uniref:Uncharacterized protein n=1 Tax=Rhodofomes roseus TaxID=34475 RepID=A0A4Y9Z2C7_9APHY|nr:hypothetical protein EVJ58_g1168 [Rhodofomes roseus]
MPPDDPEVIDLTKSSPAQNIIELDSDGEIMNGDAKPSSTANGKAGNRKRKKPRRRKTKVVEEGEVTQSSVEASREQSPERVNGGGAGGGGSSGASREAGAKAAGAKSLFHRLTSPGAGSSEARDRYERDEDGPREKDKQKKRRDRRSPPPERDSRRRSRSPDRLRNPRHVLPQDDPTRQNGDSVGRRRLRTLDCSGHDNQASTGDSVGDLFFEDVVRADIPAAAKIQQKDEQPTEDLLLPAHVSVFDQEGVDSAPIVSPPSSDSEDESYIEYLDYDDDRKVRLLSAHHTIC